MSKPRANEKTDEPRKIGEGSLKAWARQGHKELTAALKAFPDSLPLVEEPGMPSNPTSYEVTRQRGVIHEKDGGVHGRANDRDMEPDMEP